MNARRCKKPADAIEAALDCGVTELLVSASFEKRRLQYWKEGQGGIVHRVSFEVARCIDKFEIVFDMWADVLMGQLLVPGQPPETARVAVITLPPFRTTMIVDCDDTSLLANSICSRLEENVFPFFSRYSNTVEIIKVLSESKPPEWLILARVFKATRNEPEMHRCLEAARAIAFWHSGNKFLQKEFLRLQGLLIESGSGL